ncbi:L-gulonolactone oxidase [Nocardioides luteus]|uniref:L-gulonolactone oxidase n=1 Tax=Nocardioides luteus TaxID=1844 RepID=A0ABQ5SYG7_9ACTN|nr:D-arabinono-1,4-lactone oxidase [Nocardioides luteus]MDR7312772.1 L-gulonolactone oxidase [Nocardioides luteus]GGR47434.1 L-gulonolactone oxidase [Nocardioides luteus]GLJ69024.1 L-gulonolactone oxidase [Nocardioides luteus]
MSWQNWAGTARADPARVVAPASTEAVVAAVKEASRDRLKVRMIGSGHSFTGAAVAPGVQLVPDRLDGVHSVDRESGLVTVDAGIPLHRLNPILAGHELAMEILGDIDRQTLAGAISTGTHGSGAAFGNISTQVRGLELVLADGSVVQCSATERPELFEAARVSFGALGVITKVTLQCVPLYALHAVDAAAPLDEVLDGVDDLVAANDHFEFFWFPHTTTALARRFNRLPGDTELRPMSRLVQTLDDRIVTNVGFEAMLRVGTRFPRLVPGITRFVTKAISARDFTDLAPNVFASERNVRFREGEYFVPRDALVPALRELKRWVDTHDEPVSFPFEVRFVRHDDIWLSPAYERDSAVVAFHQYHRMPHERWFSVCEDVLGAAGGRPHWGKMHRLDASALREVYPRFDDFVALRDRLDPTGIFANPYLDRLLGPAPEASS